MKLKVGQLFTIAFTLVCLSSTGVAQPDSKYKELPKFHGVDDNLYRGAQPKKGGLARLAQLGVRTVINLRTSGDRARKEEIEARALGLQYYNVPLPWYGRPTDEQVQQVLQIITAPENQPVFVHCSHGVDRTGLIVAVYRITKHGWTSADAKAEAKRFGMHWWKFGLKDYIRDYYKRTQRTLDTSNQSRFAAHLENFLTVARR
jgi:protein tyrosine/serine phosphatase